MKKERRDAAQLKRQALDSWKFPFVNTTETEM